MGNQDLLTLCPYQTLGMPARSRTGLSVRRSVGRTGQDQLRPGGSVGRSTWSLLLSPHR